MVKNGFPLASFVLGFLLGPLAEINLRRAFQTDPNLLPFVLRPISALLLLLAVLAIVYYFWVGYRRVRAPREPAVA
jgi:putative tricarboxylic transport membrane protein